MKLRQVPPLLAVLAASACKEALTQRLDVNIADAGVARPAVPVRIVASAASAACAQPVSEATTDAKGSAVMSRTVYRGKIAVIVDDIGLCIFDRSWRLIWHAVYGPASPQISVTCDLGGSTRPLCSAVDGEGHSMPNNTLDPTA